MSTESSEASRVHLLAVRKALSNRNAAVMVGSGFSRNADGGENLATWRQLSEALAMELEPDRAPGSFSPASASQLAEQYSRVFSPTHLEQLIKRCVPDDQVTPGPLHNSLLELPWSEVFTTNYDTLLERAAERMFDVSYFTVCSREDIPQSKVLARRRIVKLHGSFPSHRPFILTEEDYRTYPERFAPFVNLVRQSLLENVFCLIGFSGDDPNFLHWLGWVRDMLDKHALPVYLFLSDEPTLGERKLYEARGVIPVLLPAPEGVSRDDFQARYRALFDELKKPLSNSPLDWGSCARLKEKLEEEQGEPQLVALLDHLPMLHACRSTYPGWIVAPREVRRRFQLDSNWLEHALGKKPLRDRLALRPAPVVLTVLEVYFWVQQVTLGPILDSFAELALDLLAKWQASDLERVSGESLEFLAAMDARNADSARRMWTHVALALLTWARQSHRSATYRRISELLAPVARKDTAVHDRLIYEEVLRCLQAGDRPAARHTVLKWRPKGPDAYMHVLRGSLMAEVGDPSAAMPAFEQAIQTLRRQQRSRPGDPELISKEAWACVVANHVQEAAEFGWLVRGDVRRKGATDEKEEKEREDFDGRLNVLVARGYSAREELSSVLAKLNAEAVPPQVESSQLGGFDLGTTSSRRIIGGPTEFRNKVAASFAWLELMERVGLLPQTRNASFFADAMLQAAWWTRFADRSERAIGLLLRANRPDSLKPRDPFLPPHRTGWLGRYQVAQFGEDAATELASELLIQIELEFDGTRPSSDSGSRAAFLLEAFGRLVIRVRSDSLLVEWGHRLLGLHRSVAFQAEPTAWESSSKAIGRLLEALPSHSQGKRGLKALLTPTG